MSDWNDVINADLKDAESPSGFSIPDGIYEGMLANVESKTFRSGGKGLEITYSLKLATGEVTTIRDYFVVRGADGKTNKVGAASVKKLLMECGVTDLSTFVFPAYDSKTFGGFKNLLESPLTLDIKATLQKKGANAGKTYSRVKKFSRPVKQAA